MLFSKRRSLANDCESLIRSLGHPVTAANVVHMLERLGALKEPDPDSSAGGVMFERAPEPIAEGHSKGGQNPPNPASSRPPEPQGSGGKQKKQTLWRIVWERQYVERDELHVFRKEEWFGHRNMAEYVVRLEAIRVQDDAKILSHGPIEVTYTEPEEA